MLCGPLCRAVDRVHVLQQRRALAYWCDHDRDTRGIFLSGALRMQGKAEYDVRLGAVRLTWLKKAAETICVWQG